MPVRPGRSTAGGATPPVPRREQAGVTQQVTVGLWVKGDDAGDDAFGLRCEPDTLAEAFAAWAAEGVDELIVLLEPVTLDRAERAVQALHDWRGPTP